MVLGDAMPDTITFKEAFSGIPSPAPKSRPLQRRDSVPELISLAKTVLKEFL